ncbi:ribosome maturation factor RimP [Parasphingorhabdus marina DSM 22363]|uniref:Ribosome maturation factor RimP n=1 Tax=Parasphingorhabdus marina DSM 22363 TaxID=1123272 RepID=A0A1N6ESS7_9SPHN|nr:ribosome maturation protein RimP [Parasphingorhabdus marina]SIN86085.1 ribosome maturation factor RimP [Parasphingorhabdus marina DSM 22363]
MADLNTLEQLIEPEATALGFDLVRVQFVAGADELTLQVMAERPETGQLNIDDCAALSRRISEKFDEIDPIAEAYRLEVSSPGIDRPLTRAKDYANWAGHEARINLIEAVDGKKQLRGLLAGAEGEIIAIDDRKSGRQETALSNVHSAKLILTDALIAATVPVSPDGADEIEEDTLVEEQED